MKHLTQTIKQSIRLHAGDTNVLHLLQLMEERHGWLRGATMRRQARQRLHADIAAAAVPYDPDLHGYVYHAEGILPGDPVMPVIVWSRDCDCCEGTSLSYIRASLPAYDAHCAYLANGAEGPWSISIASPDDAAEFQPYHRDRVLEAFEDGHPFNV